MEKILVTGGAGFIGSHVVDRLIKKGKKVIVVDNLSSGNEENINNSNNVRFFQIDITDSENLKALFVQHKDIEGVIHLAAQSKVTPSVENPLEDATININGTINLLDLSNKHGVKNFVYASSAAVYGHTETLPIQEETPASPLSPYGVSKYAGEEYVKAYGRLYGMNVSALRFANVYGPRQTASTEAGVITIFIEQLLRKEQPVIYGDGEQTRDFIYVDDVVSAVISCLINDGPSTHNPAFNVSTGEETSINQLLTVLCDVFNIDFNPNYEAERPGDIKYSYLSNEKLTSKYQWSPKTQLGEGLKNTVDYYQFK
ncbi:SDR family NAD(P)-dependent oxidoreductase [Evansella sp. AB-P1]|uniref:SDR family NAD(P)-dependent oxidoreductase n=1 Tax=Evansella sp. AB-P1 TaxID=3037653 RepID=UPI00241C1263|nr:SDR family NAD(P)-dependent oxidoreductase [Evansella sp. AB-P1]MDG5786693.1 SDR family NAD(P)-dependent oxidoreductase [Evansella sp. AB-P1]